MSEAAAESSLAIDPTLEPQSALLNEASTAFSTEVSQLNRPSPKTTPESAIASTEMDVDLPQPSLAEKATTTTSKPVGSVRIHVDTAGFARPFVFNYRQLYKQEIKKREQLSSHPSSLLSALHSGDEDTFYAQLLKKANLYAMKEVNKEQSESVDDAEGSDNEEDSDEERPGSKKVVNDEYDYEDPFIDDSEMLLDEDVEYTPVEHDGFFVYHGPLGQPDSRSMDGKDASAAAAKRKTAPKGKTTTSTLVTKKSEDSSKVKRKVEPPKKGSTNTATFGSSSAASKVKKTTGTTSLSSSSAKKVVSTTEDSTAKKKKNDNDARAPTAKASDSTSTTGSTGAKKEGGTKKKTKSNVLEPLDPEIEVLMEKLREDVKKETFENKAKFPTALKPTVLEAGLIMLRKQKEIDDNLVNHLMSILPYNRFTLKKFLTTKAGQIRVDELQQEIDELIIKLKQTIDRQMPEQQKLYDEQVARATAAVSTAAEGGEGGNPSDAASATEEIPARKFRCNDEVRKTLYDIMKTEEASVQLVNLIAKSKDNNIKETALASESKSRKQMYQRLLSCWPEGWMTTMEISKQYSHYKMKLSTSDKKLASAATTTPAASASSALPSTTTSKASLGASLDGTQKKRKRPASTVATAASSPSVSESAASTAPPQKKLMTEPAHQQTTSTVTSSPSNTPATAETPSSISTTQPAKQEIQSPQPPTVVSINASVSAPSLNDIVTIESDGEDENSGQVHQQQQQAQLSPSHTPSNSMSIDSLMNRQQTTQKEQQ